PWKQKLFRKYLENWALKGLSQADEIWVARPSLAEKCRSYFPEKKIKPVMPFFNLDDYPIIPSSHWKHDVLLISTEGITSSFALKLYEKLKTNNVKFLFVGLDNHLEMAKKTINNESYFYGQKCAGDLAPLMASCLGAIDFSNSLLPGLGVRALAAGRPVALLKNGDYEKQLDQNELFWLADQSVDSVLSFLKELETKTIDANKLRRCVLKFNPASFKTKVKNSLASLESVFN
ncbi:MAG: hypothetical protein ACO2ZP_13210, partial [Bacteriovoracaceae bacterium]